MIGIGATHPILNGAQEIKKKTIFKSNYIILLV